MRLVRVDALPPADPVYVAPDSRRAHGTFAKYKIEGCHCEACREANRAYVARRNRAMSRPDELWLPYVPAARARAHCRALMAQGVGPKSIAKLSGVPHGAVSKLIYGDYGRGMAPSKRIRPETERKLLAVTMATVVERQDRQRIPAGPTWVLLNDLIGRGYPKSWIAQRLSKNPAATGLQIHKDYVYARTARRVQALHRILRDRPGPGRYAKPRKRRTPEAA